MLDTPIAFFSPQPGEGDISSFPSIHNVVDHDVVWAMWEELAGNVGRRDQLIIY